MGKAIVIDGDTIKIGRKRIRIDGIDAPELGQPAKKEKDSIPFDQGDHVKRELEKEIQDKEVQVKVVKEYDPFDRIIGIVNYDGKDVGAWLVRSGRAIAAYGRQYKSLEQEARKKKRGIWGCDESYDPGLWRHRDTNTQSPPKNQNTQPTIEEKNQ